MQFIGSNIQLIGAVHQLKQQQCKLESMAFENIQQDMGTELHFLLASQFLKLQGLTLSNPYPLIHHSISLLIFLVSEELPFLLESWMDYHPLRYHSDCHHCSFLAMAFVSHPLHNFLKGTQSSHDEHAGPESQSPALGFTSPTPKEFEII
jgi:hypothetical protein